MDDGFASDKRLIAEGIAKAWHTIPSEGSNEFADFKGEHTGLCFNEYLFEGKDVNGKILLVAAAIFISRNVLTCKKSHGQMFY